MNNFVSEAVFKPACHVRVGLLNFERAAAVVLVVSAGGPDGLR